MSKTKFTRGPWRWEVNRSCHVVELCGGVPAGRFGKTVMSFRRWGMNSATPMFWFWQDGKSWSEEPKSSAELAEPVPGREHHGRWFATINHPDAALIAAAPDLYAALETLREQYRLFVDPELDTIAAETMRTVDAALARARGEEPAQ